MRPRAGAWDEAPGRPGPAGGCHSAARPRTLRGPARGAREDVGGRRYPRGLRGPEEEEKEEEKEEKGRSSPAPSPRAREVIESPLPAAGGRPGRWV